jgi:hypothetical protein
LLRRIVAAVGSLQNEVALSFESASHHGRSIVVVIDESERLRHPAHPHDAFRHGANAGHRADGVRSQ